MTLHTRIFGVKLGLILWCGILGVYLAALMVTANYLAVGFMFLMMAVQDFYKWRNRIDILY